MGKKDIEVLPRIYNIKKEKNMTSHDVVARVRRILSTRKVGHTGTLDPDAVGVLPVCVGRATKIADIILNKDKEYICTMLIGVETDTYDTTGEILEVKDITDISYDIVKDAISSQVGEIDQYPPLYSALKVNGKKMCDLVRAGRADEINLKSRKVFVHSIDVISISNDVFEDSDVIKVEMKISCSKGTYIRSICHDIGMLLNTGATMSNLIRTKSGSFDIEDSISLEELEALKEKDKIEEAAYTVESVLKDLDYIILQKNAVKYYANGGKIESNRYKLHKIDRKNPLRYNIDTEVMVRVYTNDEEFIGIGIIFTEGNTTYIKSDKIFDLSFS